MLYRCLGSNFLKLNKNKKKDIFTLPQISICSTFSGHQVVVEEVPNNGTESFVSLAQIKKCLKDNERKFEDGFTCVTTICTNCYEKREGLIYINKITGFFVCFDCQSSGDWRNVEPRIWKPSANAEVVDSEPKIAAKSKIHKYLIPNYGSKWQELSNSCKNISSLTSEEIVDIISTFKLHTSPDSTVLKDLNILYDDTLKCLYFPLSNGKKRIVGIKQLFPDGTETSEPFKHCYGILKYVPSKVTLKWNDVIVVHNVRDFIALSSRKHSYHVICIPYGIHSLPQEILPLMEQYSRMVLWFGNNTSGLIATRLFSKKLQEGRCYMIKATSKRPSDLIEENKETCISAVMKTAEPILHECITTFSKLRQEVFAEITNSDLAQGIQWRRFPALNNLLRGHRRGELTILTGPTGCGKTTFLSEYSLDLAMQGVSTLWGSFEIRNQRLASTMLQQFSLQLFDDCPDKFNHYANHFEKLPIYFLKFHGQQSIEVVMNVVNHAFYVYDIQHVIIDNLQFMLGLSSNEERFMDRFYKQDKVIAAFRNFATQCNCHVTLIIHPRKERDTDELTVSSIFGSAKASQEADNILIIQKKSLPTLQIKKYLQILKNRYSGDLGMMPLNFSKSTLTFSGKNFKESGAPNATFYDEEELQRMYDVKASMNG